MVNSFDYEIKDEVGIHARPAGMLVQAVKDLNAKVVVAKGEKKAEAQKLMALMSLGVKKGDIVTVTVDGDEEAFRVVKEFFEKNL